MNETLKKSAKGGNVAELQQLLKQRGFLIDIDGDFGNATYRAVRAFQAQNLDQHGQPLVVDGKVGPLTWWVSHTLSQTSRSQPWSIAM